MNDSVEESACGPDPQMPTRRKQLSSIHKQGTPCERDARQGDSARLQSAFQAGHAGEWLDVQQLREWALSKLGSSEASVSATMPTDDSPGIAGSEASDILFDLSDLAYLEAGALQVLLAARNTANRRKRKLKLVHVSPELREWFEFAGATELVEECGSANQARDVKE